MRNSISSCRRFYQIGKKKMERNQKEIHFAGLLGCFFLLLNIVFSCAKCKCCVAPKSATFYTRKSTKKKNRKCTLSIDCNLYAKPFKI